ncbi:helicase HerA-like domain-containing protein [Catelliglobosispora koreensis]|uniref:helicase HerA-like domain-containing protein n=1 Tax=Catelliglobosispora koreensis TaxID=129052 RepID=UPI00037CA171|nr:helicase HerA-like domain-containing protein [Catelliglobosispora koreensis]
MVDVEAIRAGYTFSGPALDLGALVVDGKADPETPIKIPLSLINRHGLVAGATGTGKTKTLQVMAEQLAAQGVPVFLADIKGDVAGMSQPGEQNAKITERMGEMGQKWTPTAYYCEFLTLGGKGIGVPVRASVTDFGPLLLSKVLDLSDVQQSSLNLVFHFADQKGLPLVDLNDLRAVINYLVSDEGKEELKTIGGLSKQTAGVLLRNLIAFSDAGADAFFGEPEFDINDMLRTTGDGKGVVTLLELPEVVQQPALFSSFLMWMLAELFQSLPEVGDLDKPKLVFFFDEAHLLFKDASKQFLESITQTVRLIRSKGVGVFFVTQTPKDVHPDVLAQLGNRVQHALRAFTPDDAKALKATASTFPHSDYDLEKVLTQLGTGEAIITVLNEKGSPTPVAWTRLRAPESMMAAIEPNVMAAMVGGSYLYPKYSEKVDRESAYEMLASRVQQQAEAQAQAEPQPKAAPQRRTSAKAEKGLAEQILGSSTTKSILTASATQLIRSVFGTRKR